MENFVIKYDEYRDATILQYVRSGVPEKDATEMFELMHKVFDDIPIILPSMGEYTNGHDEGAYNDVDVQIYESYDPVSVPDVDV